MWQRFFSIARNTFTETIRQPIYGVILIVTTMMLILNVSLAGFTFDDDDKLLLDLGLSTLLLSGLFLSAFSATGILSREIENKTVLSVVSKPVSRPLFILGKLAGLQAALALAFYLSTLVFLLAQRHGVMANATDPWDAPVLTFGIGSVLLSMGAALFCNFFYGKHFATTTLIFLTPMLTASMIAVAFLGKRWEAIPFLSDFVGGQVILATFLVFLVVALTATVALAASTRAGQMMTLIICTIFLGVGITTDYIFGQHAGNSTIASILYGLVPNIGPFWVIDGLYAESQTTTVPFEYIGYVAGYAALLVIGVACIAIAAFQHREVG
ncbi:MAG: hypothetical protein ACYTHJ_01430 [Planctomycetota bacterium]|jgi:hypothetical protein